jgi:hypothetical protein
MINGKMYDIPLGTTHITGAVDGPIFYGGDMRPMAKVENPLSPEHFRINLCGCMVTPYKTEIVDGGIRLYAQVVGKTTSNKVVGDTVGCTCVGKNVSAFLSRKKVKHHNEKTFADIEVIVTDVTRRSGLVDHTPPNKVKKNLQQH